MLHFKEMLSGNVWFEDNPGNKDYMDYLLEDMAQVIAEWNGDKFESALPKTLYTCSEDPYSDDFYNFYIRELLEAAEQEQYEFMAAAEALLDMAVESRIGSDPNFLDDDGRLHQISRTEMGYE